MSWFQALVFAIVEGLTEFLPVSSTANILLAEKFLPVVNKDLFASFSIFIQLGAMLAVLTLFIRQLWQHRSVWLKLLVAFAPVVLLGLFFYPLVKAYLQDSSPLTGLMLILGGLLFTFLDWQWRRKNDTKDSAVAYLDAMKRASWWQMLAIGTAQATAMVPGVSRSAATIFGARAFGFSKTAATQFSFVLALPTIAAAAGLDLLQEWLKRDVQVACSCVGEPCFCPQVYSVFNQPADLCLMLFGFVVAFLVAWFTAKFFIKILSQQSFLPWGIYRVIIGLIWLGFYL